MLASFPRNDLGLTFSMVETSSGRCSPWTGLLAWINNEPKSHKPFQATQ